MAPHVKILPVRRIPTQRNTKREERKCLSRISNAESCFNRRNSENTAPELDDVDVFDLSDLFGVEPALDACADAFALADVAFFTGWYMGKTAACLAFCLSRPTSTIATASTWPRLLQKIANKHVREMGRVVTMQRTSRGSHLWQPMDSTWNTTNTYPARRPRLARTSRAASLCHGRPRAGQLVSNTDAMGEGTQMGEKRGGKQSGKTDRAPEL